MTNQDSPEESFGCEQCWPPGAPAAWKARGALSRVKELIDESDFHVLILGRRHCAQRFLSVFTEMIDWVDGDDPQYWTLLPLTQSEAAGLETRDPVTESELRTLGPGRRCLLVNHPKAGAQEVYWEAGLMIGPHD